MGLEYLTLNIKYNLKTDEFETSGNIKDGKRREIVGSFLREMIGSSKDESKMIQRDTYNIQLKWYPDHDKIEVISDTGNKVLRDGILLQYLSSLNE